MTTRYKTKAFVFKKNDLNESDRVFSVFTDDFGRLDIFAKAIRKAVSKLRSGIDIFFMSDIEFIQGRNRKTLTDTTVIEKINNLTPDKFGIASMIGDVLDNFIKGEEKDENIFNLINNTFVILNDYTITPKSYTLIYYYFLWNFLALSGYKPQVDKCSVCYAKLNPYNIYFSDKSGGIICKKCLSHDIQAQKINSDIIKILRMILKEDWQTLSKLKITPASQKLFQKISDNYYLYILSSHSFSNSVIINTIQTNV